MKKIFLILSTLFILFVIGCTNLSNTPKQKVEELFNNYQTLDDSVIGDLNNVVDSNVDYNTAQREMFKDIMAAQFRNLTYQIKDDETNANKSVVTAEITVKDFSKVIKESEVYLNEHKDEFMDSTGLYKSKFIDYQLEQMKKTNDKVKYNLEINLSLSNDKWSIDKLSDDNVKKICGVYQY